MQLLFFGFTVCDLFTHSLSLSHHLVCVLYVWDFFSLLSDNCCRFAARIFAPSLRIPTQIFYSLLHLCDIMWWGMANEKSVSITYFLRYTICVYVQRSSIYVWSSSFYLFTSTLTNKSYKSQYLLRFLCLRFLAIGFMQWNWCVRLICCCCWVFSRMWWSFSLA